MTRPAEGDPDVTFAVEVVFSVSVALPRSFKATRVVW